jgi:hypothetical protein
MSSKVLSVALCISACILMLASRSPAATCSNATVTGNYGFQVSGMGQSGDPRADNGQLTADGNGNFTGTETTKVAGVTYTNVSLVGTYKINSNCSGTGTFTPAIGPAAIYNFVILSDHKTIQIVNTTTLRSQSGYAVAQGSATCSTAALKGNYGFQGGSVGLNNPGSGNGQLILDGAGNLTGNETISINGQILSGVAITGTYSMNSNCQGTATLVASGISTIDLALVVVNSGQAFLAMETDQNTTLVGSIQKAGSAACSKSTLKGVYAVLDAGTANTIQLDAFSNQFTADGLGNLTGTQTSSQNGAITSSVATTGTYQINSNCTGSISITPLGGAASNYNLVVITGTKPLLVIDTDANTNQVGFAEVEGRPVCTVAGIKGTFGIALNGTPLLIDPVAIGGQVKLDGLGNVTGSETASYNGKITKNSPITGTYTINADCTGTASLTAKNLPTLNLNLTVANGGNALVAIETDSGTEVSGALQH